MPRTLMEPRGPRSSPYRQQVLGDVIAELAHEQSLDRPTFGRLVRGYIEAETSGVAVQRRDALVRLAAWSIAAAAAMDERRNAPLR